MKKNIILFLVAFCLGGLFAGTLVVFWQKNPPQSSAKPEPQKPLYWVAPMDPSYKRDKPGKSPMGMDLVPVYKKQDVVEEGVKIPSHVMHNIGVKIDPVEKRTLHDSVNTVGVIHVIDNHVKSIHVYKKGWVSHLYINQEGTFVHKGQLLAQVYSPELVEAQQELVLALKNRETGQKQGGDYQDTNDYVDLAKEKLKSLGVSSKQIAEVVKTQKADNLIDIYSPVSGVVSEFKAKEGMYVTPQTTLMTIVNLEKVWLSADVFPHQAHQLALGDTLTGKVDGLAHKTFKGEITFISPTINATTRTISIRATLDNANGMLKPNLFMDAHIQLKPIQEAIVVPASAVIRLKHLDYVILAMKDNRFVAQEVKLGLRANGYYQILEGLHVGQKVVTSAQFLIDSESDLQASLRRLSHASDHENKAVPAKTPMVHSPHQSEAKESKPMMHHMMSSHTMPSPHSS